MPQAGDVLVNRYTLESRLGAGAAAEVWRARDERLGRPVAIKILRPQYISDAEARTRFEREARAAAGLSHPNVVDVYDYGATDDTVFIAMMYIDGEDLKRYIAAHGRLDPREAARIALAVTQGLEAAHAQGLIHRDIKPQNIMIDRHGVVRITDFGVAKALSGPNLTEQGMTYGTAAYLSPEQAAGRPVGPASDVYGLGIVLYEMLCGQPPFQGENAAAVAYQQVYTAPPPLAACNPAAPPMLVAVVDRSLEKSLAGRYPTPAAMAADLRAYLTTAERITPPYMPTVPAYSPATYGPAPLPPPEATPAGTASPPVPATPAPAAPVPAYAPTASYAVPPAAPAVPARRGFAPWMALPVLALVLLACGFGASQMGLLRLGQGGSGPLPVSTPAPTATVAAGGGAGVVPTPTVPAGPPPGGEATPPPAPQEPTQPPAPPAPPAATATSPRGNPVFPPPTVPVAQGNTVTVEDVAFVGAYRYQPPSVYEGRTAAWVYGQGTNFTTMRATFNAAGQPTGAARLTISGLDSEGAVKTPMRIRINDGVIFDGPNPLPNDYSPNPGNWGLAAWTFDSALLRPGANTLTIENRAANGAVGRPPFIMVDFARVEWEGER